MLSLEGILDLLNDRGYKEPPYINRRRQVYYRMALHIDGACPAFINLRDKGVTSPNAAIYPHNYFGIDFQYVFETFLYNRHAREAEVSRQWRMSQHKPFTKAPFINAIQTITGAIFQDSGWGLKVDDAKDDEFVKGNNFHGLDLVSYIQSEFKNICSDPNAVFLTMPRQSAIATGANVEPDIWFVPSKFIKWHTDDEIVFYMGEIAWVVNSMGYFRFAKDSDEKWFNMDAVAGVSPLANDLTGKGFYYLHLLGETPITVAGGDWNSQGYYDSWLDAARAWADEYISSKSAEQMVIKEASHPWIIEPDEECPTCHGNMQVQYCRTCSLTASACQCGNAMVPHLVNCDTCGGSGTVSHNPGERYIVPVANMDKNLVQIISPPVDLPKFHVENNAEIYNGIMRALHLAYIEEAQSAVAKSKDMETRYQFILRICNDIFDRLLPRMLNSVLSLRNARNINGVLQPYKPQYMIIKPTEFQVKTSYDLLSEFKEAKESKIPDFQLCALLNEYTEKQFGGNDMMKKKTDFITMCDPLAMKTDADIQIVVMNNFVSMRKAQYHYELPTILDTLIKDFGGEWFINATYDDIKGRVDAMFATMIPPVLPIQPTVVDRNYV